MMVPRPSPIQRGGGREGHFLAASPTPRRGAEPEPTSPGLSHPAWGAGPCARPAVTRLLLPACWVLAGTGEMPDPERPRRCPGAAPYVVQEVIRGSCVGDGARQRAGRLFAHWPPAPLLIAPSFTAAAPQPSCSAPQTGRWGASCQKGGEAALENTHPPKPPASSSLLKWGN